MHLLLAPIRPCVGAFEVNTNTNAHLQPTAFFFYCVSMKLHLLRQSENAINSETLNLFIFCLDFFATATND